MNDNVRVRFAPSPTGPLHIGGVRTALYNYLFAKKHKGKLILRIEDTDQKRFVEGAEAYIIEALEWSGILFDEGVHLGGNFAPYKQSERSSVYEKYVAKLIEDGHAYYAFDKPEDLEKIRADYQLEKKTFQYDASTRMQMCNSLSLTQNEVKTLLENKIPYVVRVRIPENEEIVVNDLIRGEVKVSSSLLDDKVLFKSDGLPTYHLANVVDDHLMQISHVIRGEEWLPSAPLHVLLYRMLGCEDTMPAFAHLPLILKPEGNGKLSKRDGDKHGFPVFPLAWQDPETKEVSSGYRESGYLPDAFVNMLAFLGWNPGTEQELFSMQELIEQFSIERVNKSGAKFDPEKTKWFNQQYIKQKNDEELAPHIISSLAEKGINCNIGKAIKISSLFKERSTFIKDLSEQSLFLFVQPEQIDTAFVLKKCKPDAPEVLKKLSIFLDTCTDWQAPELHEQINKWMLEHELGAGRIMLPLRLSLVGEPKGPELFDILELLGKEESLQRIENGIKLLSACLN